MKNTLRLLLSSTITIVLFSIIIGFCLWILLGQNQVLDHTVSVPLVVYDQQKMVYQVPVAVRMRATRAQVRMLALQPPQIALYREEHPEKHVVITPYDIVLPEAVTVVDYMPRSIDIP